MIKRVDQMTLDHHNDHSHHLIFATSVTLAYVNVFELYATM